MTFTSLLIAVALGGVAAPPAATVGFFDPYAPFTSPLERARFTERLAEAVSKSGGKTVGGAAYSKAADLIRDLGSNRVHVGMVNPQFIVGTAAAVDVQPILVGTREGSHRCPYALYASVRSRARNLSQLKGKRLAIVRAGSVDANFILNAILQGEVRDVRYFKNIVLVPDLAGAIGTLRFGRADAFFGPDLDYRRRFRGRGLRRLASTGSTLCMMVVVDRRLKDAQRRELKRVFKADALVALITELGLDGFTDVPTSELAALKGAINSDPKRFAEATPLFVKPNEPNEKRMQEMIEAVASDELPDPSLLVVERDGL